MTIIGTCCECGRKKKELVENKNICWRCHLGTVQFNTAIEAKKKKDTK